MVWGFFFFDLQQAAPRPVLFEPAGAGVAQELPRAAECRRHREDQPEDRAQRQGAAVQRRLGPDRRYPDRILLAEVPDRV